MKAFFLGWRRKAGVISLALALAVFGMWMRSRVVDDLVDIPLYYVDLQLVSCDQRFSWSFTRGRDRWPSWTTFDPDGPLRPEHAVFEAHYIGWIVPPIVLSFWLLLRKPRKRPFPN